MAASDRLHEITAEVHDCEERVDRLGREVRGLREAVGLGLDLASATEDELRSLGREPSPRTSELIRKLRATK